MSEHTPEPWSYCEDNDGWCLENGCEQHGYALSEANARRIVACVNICAGVSIEMLEASTHGCVGAILNETIKASRYRDELLAALKGFVAAYDSETHEKACDVALSAIAKCEK